MPDDYMEKYKKYIYKSKEDEMVDVTTEDVQEEIRTLKETAWGYGPMDTSGPEVPAGHSVRTAGSNVQCNWKTGTLAKRGFSGKSSLHGQGRRNRT